MVNGLFKKTFTKKVVHGNKLQKKLYLIFLRNFYFLAEDLIWNLAAYFTFCHFESYRFNKMFLKKLLPTSFTPSWFFT